MIELPCQRVNDFLTTEMNELPYHSFDREMRSRFGGKVYRLSLQTGCSCPNRDGTAGTGGCIFCSAGGSGDFASGAHLPVKEQMEEAADRVRKKLSDSFAGYVAYFQSYTNTYGPVEKLERIFSEAAGEPLVLAVSVATRPDCLPEEMVAMLSRVNRIKPVWVELGLQTVHEDTAAYINRGYPLETFEDAARRLKAAGLEVIVHVIIGLPGEDKERTKETVRYLAQLNLAPEPAKTMDAEERGEKQNTDPEEGEEKQSLMPEVPEDGSEKAATEPEKPWSGSREMIHIDGIKLQMLQVLKNTRLALLQEKGEAEGRLKLPSYTPESYADLVTELVAMLPPEVTVHRLTGDPPKRLLLSPEWTADKKRVLNRITGAFKETGRRQGCMYEPDCSGNGSA